MITSQKESDIIAENISLVKTNITRTFHDLKLRQRQGARALYIIFVLLEAVQSVRSVFGLLKFGARGARKAKTQRFQRFADIIDFFEESS